MSNINDYLIWRGDIPISKGFEFNEIDSLICARFSYFPFYKINFLSGDSILQISEKMSLFDDVEFNYNGDKELLKNLGESNRFKDLIVTDYVLNKDRREEEQFSAITIHLPNNEIYISFLGTDGSIVGWKEDFNMSFMKNIPSQLSGIKYLEEISAKYPNKKIRIGGHSKGGNIAVYSALNAPLEVMNRIEMVVNYDGPGFDEEMLKNIKNNEILEKIITYIPQDSIIGRILEHKEKIKVVLSKEKGIFQHDIYSWQVLKNTLIKVENPSKKSERMYYTMKNWIKNTTIEQRKNFFDIIFDILYSTDVSKFSEISANWTMNAPKLYEKYKSFSEEDRKLLTEMIMEMGKAYFEKT